MEKIFNEIAESGPKKNIGRLQVGVRKMNKTAIASSSSRKETKVQFTEGLSQGLESLTGSTESVFPSS